MSAPEAIRGFNFQTAVAVGLALDALADPGAASIRVEGAQDIVDIDRFDAGGVQTLAAQIKARSVDAPIGPAEVGRNLQRLADLEGASEAQVLLLTNGRFGPKVNTSFRPALKAIAEGRGGPADRQALTAAGLTTTTEEFAGRVQMQDLQPGVDVQLSLAETAARSLIELHEPCDAARARAAVDALFVLLGLMSGEQDAEARIVTRTSLAAALRVPLASIDAAGGWDASARSLYLEAVLADPLKSPMIVSTDVAVDAPVVFAVKSLTNSSWTRHGDPGEDEPVLQAPHRVDDLLRFSMAALAGPAGGGKSTSVGLLARVAAEEGLLPIVLAAADVTGSTVEREATRAAQIRLGRTMAPGAGAAMLRDAQAVLIVDGAGDLPPVERASLVQGLRRLRGGLPRLRVIATGRDRGALADMHLPVAELLAPTVDERLEIAVQILGDAKRAHSTLQAIMRTSTAIGTTPLLLVLALQDSASEESALSRAELLGHFVERLWSRAGTAHRDVITTAAAEACATLLAEGQRRPARYRWVRELGDALQRLAGDHVIADGELPAEHAAAALEEAGIFTRASGTGRVAAAHDMIFDLLAARALVEGRRPWPQELAAPAWLDAAELAAELVDGPLPDAFVAAAWRDPQTAAGVGRRARGRPDPEAATRLLRSLVETHGPLDEDHATLAIEVRDGAVLVRRRTTGAGPAGSDVELVIVDEAAASPPALAARVWTGMLAERLDRRVWDVGGVLVPNERDLIPEVIAEWWRQRNVAIEVECEILGEQLAARVRQLLRGGLRAWVLPAVPFTVGTRAIHLPVMVWENLNEPIVDVQLVDTLPEAVDTYEPMSVQRFLFSTPREDARQLVRSALSTLVAGLDA